MGIGGKPPISRRPPAKFRPANSPSFQALFLTELKKIKFTARLGRDDCRTFDKKTCRLCPAIQADYESELSAKQAAMEKYWVKLGMEGRLRPVVASPRGRNYRTVSKRRAFKDKFRRTCLAMTGVTDEGIRPLNVLSCPIEPALHSEIYRFIQNLLWQPDSKAISGVISYVIIKGTYDEVWIVLNIIDIDGPINSQINRLSKALTKKYRQIRGLSLVIEKKSRFYLSDEAHKSFRKVYGSAEVRQPVSSVDYAFHPLAFTQTNGSILEAFVSKAATFVGKGEALADIFCGYGLFAHSLSGSFNQITGMDSSEPSIRSAITMARHRRLSNLKFVRGTVTQDTIETQLGRLSRPLSVMLDPPRQGPGEGVIEAVAAFNPSRVVHIFCDVDLLKDDLQRWSKSGYRICEVVPFDMFPATAHLEVMVYLEPK